MNDNCHGTVDRKVTNVIKVMETGILVTDLITCCVTWLLVYHAVLQV